ncbi:MAG: N-acetylmuramoyl-L-alanine amidase, partial [Sporichthyaceae bacterium]|nr:N-acetylmuramoyl-L-alanine amidase [Sporichthyaceae bacterium]
MPRVFLAPGHGVRPDGQFDPGAVSGSYQEHRLNTLVATALAGALRRCGFEVLLERGGGDHDPNFVGSVKAADAWDADYAVEVHHNAGGGTGVEVLVNDQTSHANRQLAEQAAAGMAAALGLPNRGVLARSREAFNRRVAAPSCMPECAFVDSPADQRAIDRPGYASLVAEAICQPICAFFTVPYRPPERPTEEMRMADLQTILDRLDTIQGKVETTFNQVNIKTGALANRLDQHAAALGEIEVAVAGLLGKLAAGLPVTLTPADREDVARLVATRLQLDGEATITGTLQIGPKAEPQG